MRITTYLIGAMLPLSIIPGCKHPNNRDNIAADSSSLVRSDDDVYDEQTATEEAVLDRQGFCRNDIYTTYLREQYLKKLKPPRFRTARSRKNWRLRADNQALHFATSRLASRTESYFGALPIVVTPEVEYWIRYFKTRGRHSFMKWLVRGESVKGLVLPILKDMGVPQELFYLAMIESGFSNTAYSKARATGSWQFVSSTAKMYGLKINHWVDERRDPVKSTIAAANYLRDLYTRFGDWYLAIGAYNAGPGRMNRAIRLSKTRDFWVISRRRGLKRETRDYVPKMLAALILGLQPQRNGFSVEANPTDRIPEAIVHIKNPVDLKEIAAHLKVPLAAVKRWNPELLRTITPPARWNPPEGYPLRIAPHKMPQFALIRERLSTIKVSDVHMHKITRGETFASLARHYRIPIRRLMNFNPRISPRRLRIGKSVAIPIPSVTRN